MNGEIYIYLTIALHLPFRGVLQVMDCCKIQDMDFPTKGFIDADTRREVDSGRSQYGDGYEPGSNSDTSPINLGTDNLEQSEENSELQSAYKQTEKALQRMLSAAIAFCDGAISAGQLKAVRELLREQEVRLAKLEGQYTPPFVSDTPVEHHDQDPEIITVPPLSQLSQEPEKPIVHTVASEGDELTDMLASLDQKLARLEEDFQQGRVNSAQYRAIRRHYKEQREVALRLRQSHPESDRWKVVLEEGKTTFLLQLNEAAVHCVAFYDLKTRKLIFTQGEIPAEADDAISLLGTFGASEFNPKTGRMMATHANDGTALVLIPGRFTAALVSFSQDPPGWQVRALREVHRNFEAANRAALKRGERRALVFPNLTRFVRV
jgi:hypothetical protein